MIIGFGPHITDLGFNSGNMFKNSFNIFDQIEKEFDKNIHRHEGALGEHERFHQKDDDELRRLKTENTMDSFRLEMEGRKLHITEKKINDLAHIEIGLIVLIVLLVVVIF